MQAYSASKLRIRTAVPVFIPSVRDETIGRMREMLPVFVFMLLPNLLSACAESGAPETTIAPTTEIEQELAARPDEIATWLSAHRMPPGLTDQTLPNTGRVEIAFEFLMNTEIFQATHIGFVAQPSPAACSFRLIADAPESTALFRRLFDRAGSPGKLYALIGLYREDPESYEAAAAELADSEETIPYQSGDVIMVYKVGDVIANPHGEGYIDIASGFLTDRFYREAKCPGQ